MTKKKPPAWGEKTAATVDVKSQGPLRGWSQKTCAEANDFVMNDLRHRASGGKCPVCLQHCKVYRRPLSSEMAKFLISLYKKKPDEDGFVSVTQLELRGGDYAKTENWSFVEIKQKDKSDKSRRTSGRWRLTSQGRAFVERKFTVPSHVFLFHRKFDSFDYSKDVDIVDALGKDFNYAELMQPTPETNK